MLIDKFVLAVFLGPRAEGRGTQTPLNNSLSEKYEYEYGGD